MGALNNPPPPLLPPPPPPMASPAHRRQWKRILAALVETVQSQRSEIEALAGDCKLLEESLQLHHNNAAARITLLKSHISQMKKEEEMVRQVHASRLNLMVSAKEREALLYKEQLELADSEMEDFCVCVETLGAKVLELKEKLKCTGSDKGDTGIDDLKKMEKKIGDLEKEIRKTKHEHKKLISKKDSNISALVAEKDLIWKQFKMKDDQYTDLLKMKQMEDKRTSGTIKMMQHSLEVLQLEADKKDETIASLTTDRAMLESDVGRLSQEVEYTKQRIEELQWTGDKKDETIAILIAEQAVLESYVGGISQEAELTKQRIEKLQSLDKEKNASIVSLPSKLAGFKMSLTRCTTGKLRFSDNSDH